MLVSVTFSAFKKSEPPKVNSKIAIITINAVKATLSLKISRAITLMLEAGAETFFLLTSSVEVFSFFSDISFPPYLILIRGSTILIIISDNKLPSKVRIPKIKINAVKVV